MLPSSKGDVAMSRISRRTVMLACQAGLICCFVFPWDDPIDQYFQRKDAVTMSAGNAKAVNAATHVIDPWPRYVGNTRIPANSERMVGAVQRYQRSGAASSQGQIGQAAGPGGPGAPPPAPPSGAATPSATLPF